MPRLKTFSSLPPAFTSTPAPEALSRLEITSESSEKEHFVPHCNSSENLRAHHARRTVGIRDGAALH